jgi:hypothetical protein
MDSARECEKCDRHLLIYELVDLAEHVLQLQENVQRLGSMGANIWQERNFRRVSQAREVLRTYSPDSPYLKYF